MAAIIPEIVDGAALRRMMQNNDYSRNYPTEAAALINYENITTASCRWTGEYPTLVSPDTLARPELAPVDQIYRQILAVGPRHRLDDLLRPENGGRFVIAGGSICNNIQGIRNITDYDIFAVNMSAEDAERRISAFVANDEASASIFRTPNCITVILGNGRVLEEFQFITRTYKNVAEVLYGFDIAPSAVALSMDEDGDIKIEMTELAAFAHLSGCFPIDLERRRLCFESRIQKYYYDKRFSVIFPDLAALALTKNSFDIHTMYFNEVAKAENNFFTARRFCIVENQRGVDLADETVYGELPYYSREKIILYNVGKLMLRNAYLVSTINRGRHAHNTFTMNDWETLIGNDGELEEILCDYFMMKGRTEAEYIHGIYLILRDNEEFNEIVRISATGVKTRAEIRDDFRKIAETIAATVRERSSDLKPKFHWKAANEGTRLKEDVAAYPSTGSEEDATAPALNVPIFEMKYIEPAAYYGEHYSGDDMLVKCASKTV